MVDRIRSAQIEQNRLIARLARRFKLTQQLLRFGSLPFVYHRIADPNRVFDELARKVDQEERATGRRQNGNDLHLPYWAEVWDSGLGLAQWLVRAAADNPVARDHPRHQRLFDFASADPLLKVLDLGCGMGLTGMVAARLGARVLFADLETEPLLFARLNSFPDRARTRARRVNWQTDRLDERFDRVPRDRFDLAKEMLAGIIAQLVPPLQDMLLAARLQFALTLP